MKKKIQLEKIAFLGVGNTLKSDDGAGSILARKLKEADLIAYDGGALPETFSGTIKKLSPDKLFIIDSCSMGLEPGEFRIIPLDKLSDEDEFNSHSISLRKLISYLRSFIPEIVLIGIEPNSIDFGESISFEVASAIEELKNIVISGSFRKIKIL